MVYLKKPILIAATATLGALFMFQNCSKVGFTESASLTNEQPLDVDIDVDVSDPICDPLAAGSSSCTDGSGLKGNLYYMTVADHAPLFSNNLHTTKIDDYISVGYKVNRLIVMSQINVTPRSWTDGFVTNSGSVVETNSGDKLFEWFALSLSGFILLPDGSYEFATLSDDGMRLEISGQTLINDDGVHAPRWKCAGAATNFSASQKQAIAVKYFQGPRSQISMQLLVRPASQIGQPCAAGAGWTTIDASAFSN